MSATALETRNMEYGFGGSSGFSSNPSDENLQRFGKAKKKINDIYKDVDSYVSKVAELLERVSDELEIKEAGTEILKENSLKVEGIRGVLRRDQMKVVFFGRTSNGKSTTINALLREGILPTGIGHTTSCFLQVEGSPDGSSFILTEDSDERKKVDSISQLAHALSTESLDPNAKVRLFWPSKTCPMLGNEVVVIDSPGIDVEADLDEWIDKYCQDSDVFILVANAESTLMITEKKFFHKVSERFSKPNIFIVHNRSDAFAGEEKRVQVKNQHTERAVKFLCNELGVCSTRSEAEDRIFFISAKEVNEARKCEKRGVSPSISTEDFFPRYLEFQNFEKKFTSCLSETAVRTKFAAHTRGGTSVVKSIAQLMADVHAQSMANYDAQCITRRKLVDRRNYINNQLELLTSEVKEKISFFTEDIEYKVGKAMNEEIQKLSFLVDEFEHPFHPDITVLNVYKSHLNKYLESGVGSNLKNRLSTDLQMNIETHQQEMIDRMSALLPEDRQQFSRNILPRRESFEVLYHLNCENLCSDFQEDIRFRFSLGFSSVLSRLSAFFLRKSTPQKAVSPSSGRNMSRSRSLDSVPAREFYASYRDEGSDVVDHIPFLTKVAIASVTSQGAMGGLLLGGMVLKTIGWRAIALSAAFYGGIFAYERLTWTAQAQCREFKRQYVQHAARKFRLIVDMTSSNCSHQVQQELSSTFACLCHLVDETMAETNEEIKRVDEILKSLNVSADESKVLRNRAHFILNEFDLFDKTFLQGKN